ncbi:Dityrosine transporter 1 [Xylographa soralifera]|nr:Dityrosine transporter 1 [Xylographa soralifera]
MSATQSSAPMPTPKTFAEADPEKKPSTSKNDSTTALPGLAKPIVRPQYTAFTPGRQRFIILVVTAAGFFGPLAGNIYLPALPVLQDQFNTSATSINATVSVFMGVLAVAPLLWASLADYGGRKPLYMISLLIFIGANILLAALPANLAALFILRIVQGFGAASVLSLGAGTVADITEPKRRASQMSIVLLGPQLGPVLGPLIGGAITGSASWRWTFGFLAITCSAVYVVLTFCLPETLRSIVGTGEIYAHKNWVTRPVWRQKPVVDPKKFPKPPPPTLLSLFKLLYYPPVVIVSMNSAILFSAYYAMAVTFPRFLEDIYGFTSAEVGVAYMAPGLGLVAGSLISGRVSDWHRGVFTKRYPNTPIHPERRLHLQIPGILVSLSGILMYGWFNNFHVSAAGVIIAAAIAAFGMTWVFITTTSYLTESFHKTPATLVALASLFRNPAAAVAAVVVEPLITKMGIGWCFTGLALVELGCVASILFLMVNGKEMRRKFEEKEAKAGPPGRPGMGPPLGVGVPPAIGELSAGPIEVKRPGMSA